MVHCWPAVSVLPGRSPVLADSTCTRVQIADYRLTCTLHTSDARCRQKSCSDLLSLAHTSRYKSQCWQVAAERLYRPLMRACPGTWADGSQPAFCVSWCAWCLEGWVGSVGLSVAVASPPSCFWQRAHIASSQHWLIITSKRSLCAQPTIASLSVGREQASGDGRAT